MSDTQLYAKFKHTVQCRVEIGDEPTNEEWYELDIYSETDDSAAALTAYLEDEYGEVVAPKSGVYSVVDPEVPFRVVRYYRAV